MRTERLSGDPRPEACRAVNLESVATAGRAATRGHRSTAGDPKQDVAGLDWIRTKDWPFLPAIGHDTLAIVDLFCGCGGLTLGLREAARLRERGLSIRLAVDVEIAPLSTYQSNFRRDGAVARRCDVRELFDGDLGDRVTPHEREILDNLGEIDILVAGPPCQGHSDLNNRTRRRDPRNVLYLRAVRAAEVVRPRVVLIENVPGVLHDRGKVVERAQEILGLAGYEVSDGIAQLVSFGVPQRRRRHLLVASRSGRFDFPAFVDALDGPEPTAGDYLSGLEDEPETSRGIFHQPSRMTIANRERVAYLFARALHDLPDALRPPCHRDKPHTYVSMYGRMHWDRPAQTVTSGFGSMGQGRFVHPTRPRTITPHEAARLQGFPDFFDFSAVSLAVPLREMIGNAVPPQLTAKLAIKLMDQGIL